MVLKFVKAAEELVKGMDEDDSMKLLRLRTKVHELCIVPGKYWNIGIEKKHWLESCTNYVRSRSTVLAHSVP